MPTSSSITLHLTAAGIAAYCQELARRLPTLEKRVAALDTLITFLANQADAGEQAKPEYQAIKHTLLEQFETTRAALLDERSQRLQQALLARHLPAITLLYTSLSRDGFWSLLSRMEPQWDDTALAGLRSWAAGWLGQANQRARQATPYPDAIDFNAAGIDATEYLAMTDLCRYLGVDIK